MRRIRRTDLLTTAVVVALACTACGGDPEADASPPTDGAPTPSQAWALDGDGDPEIGDVPLTLVGTHAPAPEAVSFDGASGFAASAAPGPVDTAETFSVAAWVNLGAPTLGGGTVFADAVSQLGDEAAAFFLGVAEGAWAFSMKDADTNEPGHTIRALGDTAAPNEQEWVHLVGVHDTRDGEIRLYVDGERAAETPFGDAWRATGALTVGRSQAHSAPAGFWPGAIADVRIYATALDDRDARGLAESTRPVTPPPARPTVAPSALPDGTYEYTFTPEEAAEVISVGFSPEEAAQAGYPGVLSTLLQFADGQWQQSFSVDDVVYLVDGRPEGDGGTFTVSGDRLVLSNPIGDLTFQWAVDGDVLSLTMTSEFADPAEEAIVGLVTEHDYTLVAAG